MSAASAISFSLSPSDTGYTLTVDFSCLGTKKELPFTVGKPCDPGITIDLYSQNGRVGGDHPLSFFSHRDVVHVKRATAISLPESEERTQCLFVLDLCDMAGEYRDLESIRQS
jgi:hypothetical protein